MMKPRQPDEKALVIGYGNPSRQDDGVGYHVVDALNRRLGRASLAESSDSLDQLRGPVDAIWLQQLVPEFAETISGYDMVIFVDAHTGAYVKEIRIAPVEPVYRPSLVSHHLKPETLLSLTRDLYHRLPRSVQFSIRGYEFDFGLELSERTQKLAEVVLEEIMGLVAP